MNLNDVVIKCFRISERTVVSVTNALNSTNQGLWLGLLNRDQLSRISELQYADWKRYQQREWNIFGLYHWEEQVIDKYFSGCESLLIGAVGGGREVYALMNRGMDIDAFECNPNLIKYCRELLSGEEFKGKIVQSMPDEVPESLGLYSGMILGWGAYIHIHGQLNRIRFLNQCRAHLVSDGNLLLSFLTREGATRSLRWTYTIARLIRKIRKSTEEVELGDRLDGTLDHYFTKDEIQTELEAAGFDMVYYSSMPYGHAVGRVESSKGGLAGT